MRHEKLDPIGHVESELKDPADAPRQAYMGGPPARIVVGPRYAAGLAGISTGDDVWVLTWLDHAKRDAIQVHPHGDEDNPLTGVFATRSPHRPNPIGLHRATVTDVGERWIEVAEFDAVDTTPVLDIKPVLERGDAC